MKLIGIWIDKEKAIIVQTGEQGEEMKTIASGIETFRIHGGAGTRIKGGPQDVVHDSKYLEREKHQFRNYFKEVATHLKEVDKFAIFGPAETADKLAKELKTNYKSIYENLEDVVRADSMTQNQTKALIRNFFKKDYDKTM